MHVCVYPRVRDALATPRFLPSAPFRRHNFSGLIIAVNHCCLPTVFLPSSPFVPLPAAAHAAQSQISYSQAQRVELRMRDGVKRREGIQELLTDSLLALMKIVVSLQLGALTAFWRSPLNEGLVQMDSSDADVEDKLSLTVSPPHAQKSSFVCSNKFVFLCLAVKMTDFLK